MRPGVASSARKVTFLSILAFRVGQLVRDTGEVV